MPPSLSIVIPSHNRPELLRACLETVTRHAPAFTQIIVVDDGSAGAASAVARAFASVQTIHLGRRLGFCAAANAGIREARGAVVELLNDDTRVSAGWAETALAHFSDPQIGAVAPLVLCLPALPTPIIDSAGDRYYVGGVAAKRGHHQPLEERYLRTCRVFGASASSAFFRREALGRVGGLPESFGAYFEDVDLAFRLHRAGYQAVFEPAARVYHHVSASHGRDDPNLLARQSCNEERVFWRNLPGPVLARALPAHLAVLCGKAWRRWREGNLLPFLFGRLQILAEINDLMRHRARLRQLGSDRNWKAWALETRYWG